MQLNLPEDVITVIMSFINERDYDVRHHHYDKMIKFFMYCNCGTKTIKLNINKYEKLINETITTFYNPRQVKIRETNKQIRFTKFYINNGQPNWDKEDERKICKIYNKAKPNDDILVEISEHMMTHYLHKLRNHHQQLKDNILSYI